MPGIIVYVLADTQFLQSIFAASTQTSTIFLRLISYISGDVSPIKETWLLSPKLLHRGFLNFEVSHKRMFSTDSISFLSADERQGRNKLQIVYLLKLLRIIHT